MSIKYLISVTSEGIFTETGASKKGLAEMGKAFGNFEKIYNHPWYLSRVGRDEELYRASRPDKHPLEEEQIRHMEEVFGEEKKKIEFYVLEKIEPTTSPTQSQSSRSGHSQKQLPYASA